MDYKEAVEWYEEMLEGLQEGWKCSLLSLAWHYCSIVPFLQLWASLLFLSVLYLFSYILQFNYYKSELDDYMVSGSTRFIILFW